jgi:hypothetical protein
MQIDGGSVTMGSFVNWAAAGVGHDGTEDMLAVEREIVKMPPPKFLWPSVSHFLPDNVLPTS